MYKVETKCIPIVDLETVPKRLLVLLKDLEQLRPWRQDGSLGLGTHWRRILDRQLSSRYRRNGLLGGKFGCFLVLDALPLSLLGCYSCLFFRLRLGENLILGRNGQANVEVCATLLLRV